MKKLLHILALLCLLGSPILLAQDKPAATEKPKVTEKTMLDYYNGGGVWMHPIALCLFGSLSVLIVCGLKINRGAVIPPAVVAALDGMIPQRQVGEAYQLCQAKISPLTNAVAAALMKVNYERDKFNKAEMENAAAEVIVNEETKLMFWVNWFNVMAQLAPLLGLLGTAVGMIQSFELLAAGKAEPADLAGGIGVAMLTTALGLIVAIPSMFLYFLYRGLATGYISDLQFQVGKYLDMFAGDRAADGGRLATGYTGAVPTVTS